MVSSPVAAGEIYCWWGCTFFLTYIYAGRVKRTAREQFALAEVPLRVLTIPPPGQNQDSQGKHYINVTGYPTTVGSTTMLIG